MSEFCSECPRKCGIQRAEDPDGSVGICRMPLLPRVARAAAHYYEEPCISGKNGSGAVFFSGCSLKCIFCQNEKISSGGFGMDISVDRLRQIYRELEKSGVHNINLVNPTHFSQSVLESLEPKPSIPVVWNSGGYDSVGTLKKFEGKVQIYLPDLKYSDSAAAEKYSRAPDYFAVATEAIKEMYRQTGDYVIDDGGVMRSGVVIRHLILPENMENTLGVIDWVSENFRPGSVKFSLMSQYTPIKEYPFPELNRRITDEEYAQAENYMYLCGLTDGYLQEPCSAEQTYIPEFDLTGLLKG